MNDELEKNHMQWIKEYKETYGLLPDCATNAKWFYDEYIFPQERTIKLLDERVEELETELKELKNSGYKGSCYLCEPIGEKNQELEKKLEICREALEKIIEVSHAVRSMDIATQALEEIDDHNTD